MNENIQDSNLEAKVVPHIEFTPEQKFEFLLQDIVDHNFLNYHPYLLEDNDVIQDAEERGRGFTNHPTSIIQFLNQCCSLCYIGSFITEENPYTSDGETVTYTTVPIRFGTYKDPEISINKSDFNPRRYLSLAGFVDYSKIPFLTKSCEKDVEYTGKHIKLSSTINGESEVAKYQNRSALLTYSIPVLSGFGKFRTAIRLHTFENNKAAVIREQILRTQQYILANIVNFPELIVSKDQNFYEDVYSKYSPILKRMYYNVSQEIQDRGIKPVISEEYLPDKEEHYLNFRVRFRNSSEYVEDSYMYDNFDYEPLYDEDSEDDGYFICYADNLTTEDYKRYEYDEMYYDEKEEYEEQYNAEYYYNEYEDEPELNHFYLGIVNKYEQTVFEIQSLQPLKKKFCFKKYDDNYIIICRIDSYDQFTERHTKCGVIDIRKGMVVVPIFCHENDIKKHIQAGERVGFKYHFGTSWSNYRTDITYYGPIYKDRSDLLEIGKYIGYTIQDAIYYHGKDILSELVFTDKILISDSVFPRNIALFTSVEKSIKIYQDKHLGFSTIKDIDDVISSVNTLNDDTRFYSLYEGKTIREAIEERGLIYVKNLVENGIIEIYGNVIDELLHENPQLYRPLKEAYNRAEY